MIMIFPFRSAIYVASVGNCFVGEEGLVSRAILHSLGKKEASDHL